MSNGVYICVCVCVLRGFWLVVEGKGRVLWEGCVQILNWIVASRIQKTGHVLECGNLIILWYISGWIFCCLSLPAISIYYMCIVVFKEFVGVFVFSNRHIGPLDGIVLRIVCKVCLGT